MSSPSINYYYINLDRSPDRRERCEAQAAQYGIPLERVAAVDGTALTEADLCHYDKKTALRELRVGEHACVLSHAKVLRTFLATDAAYCVIFEDDVTFFPHTKSTIEYIVTQLTGWGCVRLYTETSKVYPVMKRSTIDPCELVFPRKVLWGSIANLFTRAAAEQLLEALNCYNQGIDSFIGCTFLSRRIPICGVFPNAVSTWDPCNENSLIDASASAPRINRRKPSLAFYIRRRLHVWKVALHKIRMRGILKRKLKRL